jgi:hypothetical protein
LLSKIFSYLNAAASFYALLYAAAASNSLKSD